MITSNQKKTALYCRLSQDDNTENESNSIQNQKMILQRYASDHHFPNPCFYVDDGYSGASFQRPGFQQMMADMENGEIGIIITKDLSRLGRNQLHTGLYIEERFPMFGVRYIAINDNVDTDSSESNELMPFKNLFKNKCRLLVGNTFSPKFRQGYIFSHNQTNIPIEHLNILVALTVYNGTLTDLNMVNQFVNDGPV